MMSIEFKEYQTFLKKFRETKPQTLRLGQAFHQHFELQKSTQCKKEFDHLYQLDGFHALAFINQNFEMT